MQKNNNDTSASAGQCRIVRVLVAVANWTAGWTLAHSQPHPSPHDDDDDDNDNEYDDDDNDNDDDDGNDNDNDNDWGLLVDGDSDSF